MDEETQNEPADTSDIYEDALEEAENEEERILFSKTDGRRPSPMITANNNPQFWHF